MTAHLRPWPTNARERFEYVDSVFNTIAPKYDVVTKLLSLGQDDRWKAQVPAGFPSDRPIEGVLDLATGTGAIPILIRKAGFVVRLVALDRSRAMLSQARYKCAGFQAIELVEGDLEGLPFAQSSFDVVTMCYGLRYVGDIAATLAETRRLLRPGGVFICLDFGIPSNRLHRSLCFGYLLAFGTLLGILLHRKGGTYWHIVESLRVFPGKRALARMMEEVGFTQVAIAERLGGISVIAHGVRPAT
jgi:demethylmenaquinone methyltransferase / 2-methoxy-6-polyprenyl-1,4-benzoquinol methylase